MLHKANNITQLYKKKIEFHISSFITFVNFGALCIHVAMSTSFLPHQLIVKPIHDLQVKLIG